MSDHELDLLVRAADPCPPDFAPDRDDRIDRAADALFAEICSTPPVNRLSLVHRRARRTRRASALRARVAVSVVTAAVLTAVIGIPAYFSDRTDVGTDRPRATVPAPSGTPAPPSPSALPATFAAAAVRVARVNPRVLVTAPGWTVRSVEGFEPTSGEMTFQLGPDRKRTEVDIAGSSVVNDAPRLEVDWYPADQYESYRADRAREPGLQHLTLFGVRAQMISYTAHDHAVMLPPQGKVFLELRGNTGNAAAFKRFLSDSVEQVDIATWLAAMPPSVVTAGNLASSVKQALTGIPLPPGFDPSSLDRGLALDSYQFGARLAGMVACGWIAEWTRAEDAGDDAAATRAVTALASSHDWKLLRDMDAEGDYPEVVWQYADALSGNSAVGKGSSPVEGYRGALGCH